MRTITTKPTTTVAVAAAAAMPRLINAASNTYQQQQQQHRLVATPTLLLRLCACVALLLAQTSLVAAGTCREAQLCCSGRDSSCVVQKAPVNAIIEDLSDKPCYCDHACLKLGDCCDDFKDHCRVLDCQVSDWGQWSECDKSCGTGMMSRQRKVLQPAKHGGKHCPSLVQKRGCQGFRCHGHRDKKILREMALLLPAALSRNRHANDSSDIRRNLRMRYRDSYKHNREHEYCVEFEVIKASKACHKLPPYNLMLEGDRITVRCDLEALVQDNSDAVGGAALYTNRKNKAAVTSSSHASVAAAAGKFEITNNSALVDEEDDGGDNGEDDEENMFDGGLSLGSDENEDYDPAAAAQKTTTTTTSTTTTTTTTTAAPAAAQSYHCRGEGLSGRTTRWSALPAPSCRGKWLRLTVGAPKKCAHSQFIFV